MKNNKLLKRLIPRRIIDFIAYEEGDEFATKIYSQEGEDILIKRIFDQKANGFFIDIGAHHPFRFSNTKLLYNKGWNGINIDANPDLEKLFKKYRPNDIYINVGVGIEPGILTYYQYDHPALNTFVESVVSSRSVKPISRSTVQIKRLDTILDELNIEGQEIDLLSIDIEGMDEDALRSNNWKKYKPTWIIAEVDAIEVEELFSTSLHTFLKSLGYNLISKCFKSVLYRKQ